MKKRKGLTSRQVAEAMEVSHVAVIQAYQSGRIPRNEDGSYDLEAVRAAWEANTDPLKAKGPKSRMPAPPEAGERVAPGTLKGLQLSRAMSAYYDAMKSKAEYERVTGSQIPTKDVERITYEMYRRVRDRMLVIADRVGPVVAGMSDIQACTRVIHDEIVMCLDELSEGIFPR